MNRQKFISEYGFSISLPDNWSEYGLDDEERTNGFFDTSEWTGNLRITPVKVQVDKPYDFIKNKLIDTDYKEFIWDNKKVLNYSEDSDDLHIYYWYLIERKKIHICSFTINSENKQSIENQKELLKIEEILKTIKT